jgi:hypothetical protein
MDREEPKLGKKVEVTDLEFRPRSYRGPTRRPENDSAMWLKIALCAAALILIAMGLIEWNARRQAAAISAELTRPMTAREEARFKAELKRWEAETQAETARELAELQRHITVEPQPRYAPRAPLIQGQRCIQGRRFERIEGGWRDLPHDPC